MLHLRCQMRSLPWRTCKSFSQKGPVSQGSHCSSGACLFLRQSLRLRQRLLPIFLCWTKGPGMLVAKVDLSCTLFCSVALPSAGCSCRRVLVAVKYNVDALGPCRQSFQMFHHHVFHLQRLCSTCQHVPRQPHRLWRKSLLKPV